MAALDFPNAPTNGDTFTSPNGGAVYTWDGVKWLTSSVASNTAAQNNVGRNQILNPLFSVAQRGAGPFTTSGAYTLDRWLMLVVGGTASVTQYVITDAERAQIGDEAAVYGNVCVGTGTAGAGDYLVAAEQHMEGLRRTSGKTVTVSFWAKALSGTPKLGLELQQIFGAGGAPSANVTGIGSQAFTLSTTWTRYSAAIAVPSTAAKTFGTTAGTDYLSVRFWMSSGATNNAISGGVGVQSYTLGLWGVQLEVGSTATALAKMDPEQDLARCQRFFVNLANVTFPCGSVAGTAYSTSMLWPVSMRVQPTVTLSGFTYGGASAAALGGANVAGFYLTATSTGGAGTFAGGNVTASADL